MHDGSGWRREVVNQRLEFDVWCGRQLRGGLAESGGTVLPLAIFFVPMAGCWQKMHGPRGATARHL